MRGSVIGGGSAGLHEQDRLRAAQQVEQPQRKADAVAPQAAGIRRAVAGARAVSGPPSSRTQALSR